jgi:hypothetical protein
MALSLVFAACKTDNRQITSDMIHFPPSAGGQDENAPVITFDSSTCNFGILAIGEKFPHTFRFTNTGNSPLIITQVNPSCGCTTAKDWPQQPIAPGESGQISVEFNSTGNSGNVDKSISVLTNCIPAVEVLRIQGIVIGVDNLPKVKSPVEMKMETP